MNISQENVFFFHFISLDYKAKQLKMRNIMILIRKWLETRFFINDESSINMLIFYIVIILFYSNYFVYVLEV